MSRRRKHRRNIIISQNFKIFIFLLIAATAFSLVFSQLDKRLSEIAIEISHTESKLEANKMIDQAVSQTIDTLSLESSDLFVSRQETPEAISANTLLINQFCSLVSDNITNNLYKLTEHTISVPFGQLTGVDFFANSGPSIPFSLRPMGAVNVDYETSFNAVGINQTNFKIWININMDMKVVYPMRQESVALSRKIMLVDTVISGTVPEQYLNFGR